MTPRTRRERILLAQAGRCYLCGGKMLRPRGGKYFAERHWWPSLDHITPLSDGGAERLGNVALAHAMCNGEKGRRAPRACDILFGYVVRLQVMHNRIYISRRRE